MSYSASVFKDDQDNIHVQQLREVHCPTMSCGRMLGKLSGAAELKCTKCKAIWLITKAGKLKLVRMPSRKWTAMH